LGATLVSGSLVDSAIIFDRGLIAII